MEGLNSNCFYSKGRKLSASNLSLFPPPSICSTRSPPFLVYPLVCPWVATTNPSIVIIHPLIPVGPCPKLRHCRNRQGCPVCIEGSQALVGRTPTCVTLSVQPNTPQPQIFGGGKVCQTSLEQAQFSWWSRRPGANRKKLNRLTLHNYSASCRRE